MKNVLVTGGAGYVGNALSPVLFDSGANVTGVRRLDFGGDTLPQRKTEALSPNSA